MTFVDAMQRAAQAFEAVGAVVLVVGFVLSMVAAARAWRKSRRSADGYLALRRCFGGALLLGLEVLVAADLIRTVAVAPTLDNVGVLGLIVLIRTFLSFSLEVELEGVAPWRRAVANSAGGVRRAATRATDKQPPPPASG
ncbi:DUF1622 domain-containing protein [Streptomyces sp. NPDC056291]|uniref:DUF1622 domain-containing protein n=1 Tax=Streptomyces sp. NPDC056291 TaxID=3345772 RepID=UPI0035E19DF3